MATINKKGGFGTSCFKPILNLHETQFVGERDKTIAKAGDVWEILDVCPGSLVKVYVTVMGANSTAATMDIGDSVNATRFATALDLGVVAVPAIAGAEFMYTADDTIRLTFSADVTDARFSVQIREEKYVAENILLPGGEAR